MLPVIAETLGTVLVHDRYAARDPMLTEKHRSVAPETASTLMA